MQHFVSDNQGGIWTFYEFIGAGGCRLMCAADTQPETVERFAAEVRELCMA